MCCYARNAKPGPWSESAAFPPPISFQDVTAHERCNSSTTLAAQVLATRPEDPCVPTSFQHPKGQFGVAKSALPQLPPPKNTFISTGASLSHFNDCCSLGHSQ